MGHYDDCYEFDKKEYIERTIKEFGFLPTIETISKKLTIEQRLEIMGTSTIW